MDTFEKVSDTAREAFDKIADATSHTVDMLSDTGEQLLTAEQRMVRDCRRCVREHPLASIGLALAAGLVVSRMLRKH